MEELLKTFDDCKPKNIYNADETGLFFGCPANKTLSLKRVFSQWWKDCQGEPNSSVSLQCC